MMAARVNFILAVELGGSLFFGGGFECEREDEKKMDVRGRWIGWIYKLLALCDEKKR